MTAAVFVFSTFTDHYTHQYFVINQRGESSAGRGQVAVKHCGAVKVAAMTAVERARRGDGPTLIECKTLSARTSAGTAAKMQTVRPASRGRMPHSGLLLN